MSYEQYSPPQRFQILPPVVKNLLIINGIFFIATWVLRNRGIDLTDLLGLHYFGAEKFRVYQVITYMFMHGSLAHIFFNMFALWMFGNALENFWGSKRFLTFYIVCGIGAAITHYVIYYIEIYPMLANINDYLANPEPSMFSNLLASLKGIDPERSKEIVTAITQMDASGSHSQAAQTSVEVLNRYLTEYLNETNVVGASGAVFGILLAFGMMFPNTLLYLYFAIPIKAKYFVFFYGVAELVSGISSRPGDNVAHFAHLGGMLFGFFLLLYWRKKLNRY